MDDSVPSRENTQDLNDRAGSDPLDSRAANRQSNATSTSKQHSDVERSDPDDFSAQLCLHVEGKKIYVNKGFALCASPFFKQKLLEGSTLRTVEIELPDHKHSEVLELLRCIHPGHMKAVDVNNVFYLLPLSEDLDMPALKRRCEKLLYHHVDDLSASPDNILSPGTVVYYLYLASQHNLKWLMQKCLYLAGKLKLEKLEATKYYNKLPQDVQMNLQRLRIHFLEERNGQTVYDTNYKPPPTEIDNHLAF